MTAKDDRDLVAQLKANIAQLALRGDKTVAELAAQFNIDPIQIQEWRNELEQRTRSAFRADASPSEAPTLPPRTTPLTAPTPRNLPELPTGNMNAPELLEDDFGDEKTQPTSGVAKRRVTVAPTPTRVPAASPRNERLPGWARMLLGPIYVGWQERRHAARISRELLELYRRIAAQRPGLRREDMYRQVVLTHIGGGTRATADAILDRATESFATWPAERPLKFRDVVHYFAVSDYLASNDDVAGWTQENMGKVVARLIPDDL